MDKAKIAKLPKWAQIWIEKLESDILYHKDKVTSMVGENPDTNVEMDSYTSVQGLPKDSIIKFKIGRMYIRAQLCLNGKGETYLEIHGSDALIVRPHVTNSIHVYIEDRYNG